jgi:hypothetical protein
MAQLSSDVEHIHRMQRAANEPKHRLIDLRSSLERIGTARAVREAKRLDKIIAALETWQNRPLA